MEKYTNPQIEHTVSENKVEYIQFKKLNRFSKKFFHVITLRHGGVSKNEYGSLNFRLTSNDKKENIYENFKRLNEAVGGSITGVYKAKQNHSDNILELNEKNKEKYNMWKESEEIYDSYIIKDKGIFSLVTTADCIPIIIYDPINNIAANVHSGWKGTLQRISIKTVENLVTKYGCKVENIIVALGPSIGKCCFTTEDDSFVQQFIKVWPEKSEYISKNNNKYHIDLKYLVIKDLLALGVKKDNILNADICTKCNVEDFYSYREKTEKGKEDYGTFATIVGKI